MREEDDVEARIHREVGRMADFMLDTCDSRRVCVRCHEVGRAALYPPAGGFLCRACLVAAMLKEGGG